MPTVPLTTVLQNRQVFLPSPVYGLRYTADLEKVTWNQLRGALCTPAVLTSLFVMKSYRYLMAVNNRSLFQSLYNGLEHYIPSSHCRGVPSCHHGCPKTITHTHTHTQ
jgi:hypothetical protein